MRVAKLGHQVTYSYLMGVLRWQFFWYNRVILWPIAILNHVDTREILPTSEGSCMLCRLQLYSKLKYCQLVWRNVKSSVEKKRRYPTPRIYLCRSMSATPHTSDRVGHTSYRRGFLGSIGFGFITTSRLISICYVPSAHTTCREALVLRMEEGPSPTNLLNDHN